MPGILKDAKISKNPFVMTLDDPVSDATKIVIEDGEASS